MPTNVSGIDICSPVGPRSGLKPANPDDLEETGRQVQATARRLPPSST